MLFLGRDDAEEGEISQQSGLHAEKTGQKGFAEDNEAILKQDTPKLTFAEQLSAVNAAKEAKAAALRETEKAKKETEEAAKKSAAEEAAKKLEARQAKIIEMQNKYKQLKKEMAEDPTILGRFSYHNDMKKNLQEYIRELEKDKKKRDQDFSNWTQRTREILKKIGDQRKRQDIEGILNNFIAARNERDSYDDLLLVEKKNLEYGLKASSDVDYLTQTIIKLKDDERIHSQIFQQEYYELPEHIRAYEPKPEPAPPIHSLHDIHPSEDRKATPEELKEHMLKARLALFQKEASGKGGHTKHRRRRIRPRKFSSHTIKCK